jgi:hypothetical protein
LEAEYTMMYQAKKLEKQLFLTACRYSINKYQKMLKFLNVFIAKNLKPITLEKNIFLIFMHRKAFFVLVEIFLAVALIVPPLIFILQADHDLDNLIVARDNPGLVKSGNPTITNETTENHSTNIIYAAIIEAVFVTLVLGNIVFCH